MAREFFDVLTVAEALGGFELRRRTGVERVRLEDAAGRVPAADVRAGGDLPGFARATVDGYAVRAADTFGASEGLPAYLDVTGAVRMGLPAATRLKPATAVAIPTGGALPEGADAVVMVEHTAETMPGTIEVVRAVAPGDGLVRADEDVPAGGLLVPAGRPLRPHDVGVLAAAGVTALDVHRRPRVAILSTGDEVVPPSTPVPGPGRVRDATGPALTALVAGAGGEPDYRGIVADDVGALVAALREALEAADLVLVSAGSSVGARDATGDAVAALGPPGVFCHGLAVRPGKPTILATAGDVPVLGLPGNPLSALVVFRLVGLPVLWRLAGAAEPPAAPGRRARLARDVPSAVGRLDIVQVRLDGDVAHPLFGKSALLSLLAAADGFVRVAEEDAGLLGGTEVSVELYR